MQTIPNNTVSISFAKELVDSIDSFLHKGARKQFKTIEDAAEGMKSIWQSLRFPPDELASTEWQRVGITILDGIISGDLKGLDAEEHLHGVNGMFNQSFRSAMNVSKMADIHFIHVN